jgi:hypothetical protein
MELGIQERGIVLQVARKRTSGAFSTIPQEFDINPDFLSWGKFTLATTLYIWSLNLVHLLSVITIQKRITQFRATEIFL